MSRIVRALIGAFLAASLPVAAADLVVGLGADVTSIDPHFVNLAPNNSIAEQVFDPLVRRDARQRLVPGLAESWRAIDDLTWEFRLRKGVKFHDGSDFTAADVVFTLDRPATIKGPGGFTVYTRPITEKTVVDPHTIRLKTATPYPNMPIDMSGLVVVSSRAARGASTEDFNSGKAAVGTGPFRFVRYAKGDRVELARNDAYWGGAKPAWEKVTFRLIASDPSRIAALLAGDVQMIEIVPTADYAKLKGNKEIATFVTASNRMIHLHLDSHRDRSPFVTDKSGKPLEKNPLKDARVRHAISKAINRAAIVERVMEGLAIPAGQLVPEGFFGYIPAMKPEAYDPEGARKLLAQAGYPDGFGLTLHGPNNRYINDEQIAQTVAQMLARVGIVARVETMPMSVYTGRATKAEFSVALLGWGVSTGEASYPLRSLLATWNKEKGFGPWNLGRYSNPKMDQVLEQALATVENAPREKLLQDATRLVIADHGLIPLHYQVNTWAARRNLIYVPRTDERTYAHEVKPAQ